MLLEPLDMNVRMQLPTFLAIYYRTNETKKARSLPNFFDYVTLCSIYSYTFLEIAER